MAYTGAVYDNANVGTASKVTVSGISLTAITGSKSSAVTDYALSATSKDVSASITAKPVTASASKSYDGTTSLAGDVTLAGMLGGDTLNYTGAASNNSHVATSNKYISALTLTNGTGLASNYAPPAFNYNAANNNVSITTATLTPALTNTGVTKTYDGIVSAPGGFTPTWSYGGLVSGDTAASVAYTGAVYDNANVGTASKVTVSGISLTAITGSKSSAVTDYALSASSKDVSASISKTTLTVRANNNAKFVLAVDPAFTASYAGYVNGEVAGVLGGTLSISRSNAAVNTAGIFAGVLIPSGRTSSNYNISYTAGNFTIVPSNQLLVRVANVTDTYGTATQYTVNDVEYYDGSVYSLSDGSVAGSSVANNGANVITVADGVGGTATFTLGALSGVTSTANKLAVGTYQHGTSGTVTENSANFSNTITVVGSHTVNVKGLTASVTGVSKVYDATVGVASASFVLSTLETNDVVGARSLRSYSNKNAGTGLGYTLRNILLTGADASNYFLTSGSTYNGTNGVITPAPVTASASKAYDGTTSLAGSVTLAGMLSGDTLNYTGATSNDSHVALVNKHISALTLTNGTGLASNYAPPAFNYSAANNNVSITASTLTPVLSNTGVTKTYDGTINAPNGFAPTWVYGGLVSGDTAASVTYGGAVYDNPNSGTASKVTVSGILLTAITGNNNSALTDYSLSASSRDVSASITPINLAASASPASSSDLTPLAISASKAYDGTTSLAGNVTLSGMLDGETLNYTGATSNDSHVATANKYISALTLTNGTGLASNYALPAFSYSAVNNNVSITAATLTPTLSNNNVTKTYDGATSAPKGFTPIWTYAGLATGDTAASVAYTRAIYDNADVGTASKVTVSGISLSTITGSNSSALTDYALSASSRDVPASITTKTLTVSVSASKVYDGTTSLAGSVILSGMLDGETLNYTGATSNDSHVATANKYISALTLADGTGLASNYTLPALSYSAANNNVSITAATLTPTLSNNNVTKTYDGATSAPTGFTPTWTYAGLVTGDTAASVAYARAVYDNADVGTASKVTVSGLSLSGITGTKSSATTDYGLSTSSRGVSASITEKPLTLSAIKVYDGTTSLTGSVTLGGMENSETLNYTGATSNDSHVATANKYISALTLADGTGLASNYTLPALSYSAANNNVSITAATLTPTLSNNNVTKTYDGATSAPTGFTPTWTYAGLVTGDTAASVAYARAVYDNADVGTASKVTVSGLSLSGITGTKSSATTDYGLSTSSRGVSASITEKPLTLSAIKVYDGTTSLTGSVTLGGMENSETLNYTGATSNDSHVATANKYISALTLADGTGLASNYTLPALSYSAANNNVSITAATLTPTLSNNNVTKTYDGATSAPTGFTPTWTYAGLVTGDTAASVAYARAVYDNADVGTASKVTVSGLSLSGITGTKSSATTDYGLSTSSRGVSASITEKPLTLSAIKVYDGTTSLTGSVTLGGMENSETLNYTGATSNDSHVATANKYISALTLADGTGLASNYTQPALSYSSHNKVIISDSASSILGSGFDPVERRCMGVARSRHCLSSGLEVEVAEPVNFEPEVVEQETIEVGSNRDAFDEVARQYQDFAEVDVPPLTATSGATPGQDDQSQGQLSAVTGGDSRSDATALGDTENAVLDQRITELETQLAQGPEEVNGVRVEREEIDSRMADLEAQIEPSQEIIRLRNIQLAQLQDSLNAAAARFITEQQAIQDAAEAEAAALSDSGTSLTDDVMRILVGNSIFLLFSIVLAILLLVLLERLIKKRAR